MYYVITGENSTRKEAFSVANIRPIKDKSGSVTSYQIRVYRGRDVNGKQLKPFSTTWKIPEGMKNSRTIKRRVAFAEMSSRV